MKGSTTKLLVRNARSQKFLKSTGRWTRQVEAACNFPNTVNAIHTCLAYGLQEVELILRFEGDKDDRCLPVVCA
jgi:hypothetical protein